ncbi:hypothetical protein HAX54_007586, partial [Datura stramonium]|nr:hypothetical protein [Datura stramonium]
MARDTSNAESANRRAGLLKDQVRLVKRKNCDRYEIISIPDNLSFEKGKTVFTEKILSFMPSVAVISMDNYNDASSIVDGNFDAVSMLLSEKLRPFLDLRVSVTGGVHFDLGCESLSNKSALAEEYTESTEQTYDIYLLPPGEDPETCQSYLRMRNKDGKYSLMFEEWVTDSPFVISPRISFEVSVKLLGGLMALGYTIAAILKRSSHVFSDEKVCVKIDWLEQLNRHYVQVQGRDRVIVKCVADQLGLEGSYTPRTYIEQIQLEKLVNEVMSSDRVAWRNKNLRSGFSHSYANQKRKICRRLILIVGEALKSMSLDPDDAEIVASICNKMPKGEEMMANENAPDTVHPVKVGGPSEAKFCEPVWQDDTHREKLKDACTTDIMKPDNPKDVQPATNAEVSSKSNKLTGSSGQHSLVSENHIINTGGHGQPKKKESPINEDAQLAVLDPAGDVPQSQVEEIDSLHLGLTWRERTKRTRCAKRKSGRDLRKNESASDCVAERKSESSIKNEEGNIKKHKKLSLQQIDGMKQQKNKITIKMHNIEESGDKDSKRARAIKDHDEELVGAKIKVWWPLDEAFYEATISYFDPVENKHK